MEFSAETPSLPPIEELSSSELSETTFPGVPSEQNAAISESTDSPPRKETKRNVTNEQQRRELNYLSDTLRNRKIETAFTKLDSGQTLSEGERKLLELHQLGSKEDGEYITENEEGVKDSSISFTKGKPVFIEVSEGRKLQLISITGRSTTEDGNSYFKCQFKRGEGTIIGRSIPVGEVMKAQYLSEEAIIMQDFSPVEQQVLKLHADTLRDGETSLKSQNADEVNRLISEVAQEQGIIASSDIVSFLDSQAATIPPEQQAQLQEVRQALENINVMTDPDQFTDVLGAFGFTKDGVANTVGKIEQELQHLQAELTQNPADESLQLKIADKEEELSIWRSFQEHMQAEPNMDKYFENVRTGKVTLETRQEITKALRGGDVAGVLANIIPELMDDPTDTPEQKAEKEAKRKELAEKLATSGMIGLGAIFGLMWHVVSLESKALRKSLR